MLNYSKKQLWELYKQLPQELKDAIFSVENAEKISNICSSAGIEGNVISQIAKYTGYVLMGILPPNELQPVLEKEEGLKKNIAKEIAWQINRFIFLPVKNSLEALYGAKITPALEEASSQKSQGAPVKNKKIKEDKYREKIEN